MLPAMPSPTNARHLADALQLDAPVARAVMLSALGLSRRPPLPATRDDVLAQVRRLGALQIDTIHVVARSAYFTLYSRVGPYDPAWPDELLAEGALFEYWAHAACLLPMEDYPLWRHRMLEPTQWRGIHEYLSQNEEAVSRMLALMSERGEVRSADFERARPAVGWWDWKPEKDVLEALFLVGRAMVARRERFQRVYALRERVLPDWDEARALGAEDAQIRLTEQAVRALGVAAGVWVADYFRLPRSVVPPALETLAAGGAIVPVIVDGWPAPAYVHRDNLPLIDAARHGGLEPTLTTLLSPFDPLVWDRQRARDVFGFDYTIECYLPAAKRRYGYFCLPILRRGALVGRVDAKALRRDGEFAIVALYLEPGVDATDDLLQDLASALAECARWHRTPHVSIARSDPPDVAQRLRPLLDTATI
jgi:hypothetical protein